MRFVGLLLIGISLVGCASTAPNGEAVRVRWEVASLKDVNEICNDGIPMANRKRALGCYRRSFDECTIYTADLKEDPDLHDTLGHELRHCFVGRFHR